MKKTSALCVALFMFTLLNAQYYYLDIVSTEQTNRQYKIILDQKLKKITAISFDGNQPSTDFVLEQTIANNGKQIITHSSSIAGGEGFLTSIYQNNRIVKTNDSSRSAINIVNYDYDSNGLLIAIVSTSSDFDGTYTNTEAHRWSYNQKGLPEKLVKVKNGTDTIFISFVYDDAGNVAEEIWKKKNRVTETYYYYYNSSNLLTDIVRFNRKANRMLPDFIFDYDASGRLIQMTQTQAAKANYLVWKYSYNANGQKATETVYNKEKQLLGRVEYKYQ